MIHNVLSTRATLNGDGISESSKCNLCNAEEQTVHHLPINCTLTVDFWILFQNCWYQKTNETTLSTSHILYCWHDRAKHWQALNYCLLISKYCIFWTSLRGDVLEFQNFLLSITGKLGILLKRDRDGKNSTSEILSCLAFRFNTLWMFKLIYI